MVFNVLGVIWMNWIELKWNGYISASDTAKEWSLDLAGFLQPMARKIH